MEGVQARGAAEQHGMIMDMKTIQKLRCWIQGKNNRCFDERGLALPMVLVLAVISLAIVSVMIYLVTQGTRFSGFYKRYETAREAGIGGAELTAALIRDRGNLVVTDLVTSFTNGCDCGDPDVPGDNKFTDLTAIPTSSPYYCLCAKLCDATADWPNTCSSTMDSTTTPDMQFDLSGIDSAYQISAKIVDTTLGNSDLSGLNLGGNCVACGGGTIQVSPSPYLYRVEVNSQSTGGQQERSRLSVLYAF